MSKQLIAALFLLLLLSGCDNAHHHSDSGQHEAHDHTDGLEHDHSGDDEHVDRSRHITHFTDQDELFLQYEPLVVNRDAVFLAHFTRLSDYMPPPGGFITITLSGGNSPDEIFTGKRPVRDGIHIEIVIPQFAVVRQLSITIDSPTLTTTHQLGSVIVYPTLAASKQLEPQSRPDNTTYLAKERQWKAGFLVQKPMIDSQQRLLLPTTAIHYIKGDPVIYLMRTAEFFEQRSVVTGSTHDDKIEIIQGVLENERVIIRGAEILLPDEEKITDETVTTMQKERSHSH